jgi:hypothetical protein
MRVTYTRAAALASPHDLHNPATFPDLTNLCAPRDRYNRSIESDSLADSFKSRFATCASRP